MNSLTGLPGRRRRATSQFATEQLSEGESAEAEADLTEEVPAGLEELTFEEGIHGVGGSVPSDGFVEVKQKICDQRPRREFSFR